DGSYDIPCIFVGAIQRVERDSRFGIHVFAYLLPPFDITPKSVLRSEREVDIHPLFDELIHQMVVRTTNNRGLVAQDPHFFPAEHGEVFVQLIRTGNDLSRACGHFSWSCFCSIRIAVQNIPLACLVTSLSSHQSVTKLMEEV